MEITEVRVKLVEKSSERLRAFCSITLDGAFVIRDLKVIGGTGGVFVAMPSRKLADRCPRCRAKNHLRARFCNDCGQKLGDIRAQKDGHGRSKLHADIAHPINTTCREMIQGAVLKAYEQELDRSKSPDYRPPKFDELEESFVDDAELQESEEKVEVAPAAPVASEDVEDDLDADLAQNDDTFSDYNSLIAELRQEAAGRDERRRDRPSPRPSESRPQAQEGSPAAGRRNGPDRSGRDGRKGRRDRGAGGQQRGSGEPQPTDSWSPAEPDAEMVEAARPAAPAPAPVRVEPAKPPQKEDAFGAGLG
jgi:stage V sporulation protein G